MGLCPRDKCRWYGEDKVDIEGNIIQRKCYYEPQCWKGDIDMMVETIKFAARIRKEEKNARRKSMQKTEKLKYN